uniref:Uncharacterized protein n=1 Tax=Arundo donax TaxID=35708 RepID=A0A0A9CSF8_ARUDO
MLIIRNIVSVILGTSQTAQDLLFIQVHDFYISVVYCWPCASLLFYKICISCYFSQCQAAILSNIVNSYCCTRKYSIASYTAFYLYCPKH